MRGRKPVPTVLKLLRGNPGKRKINKREPKPPSGLPSPPSYLGRAAKAEWRRAIKDVPRGQVTKPDRMVFAMYCQNAARIAELEKIIAEKGYVLVTDKGYEIQRPEVGILNKTMTLQARLCTDLGFTPSGRSRVTISEPEKDKDPTEEELFGKRGA